MTHFIKLVNGAPEGFAIVEENLRQILPNVTFPSVITSAFIEPFGFGIYDFKNQPETQKYQKVVEIAPIKNEFGVWCQTWALVEMNDAEKISADAEMAAKIRKDRNQKLKDTDWTQVADAPVDKAAWVAYRQALRDITSQPSFPWDVIWPAEVL